MRTAQSLMQHQSTLYKIISATGQQVIFGIEKMLSVFAREKGAIMDPGLYPWTRDMEHGYDGIRSELDRILTDYEAIPNFDDLSAEQRRLVTGERRWKTYMLYAYGARFAGNIAQCPETDRMLQKIPGMVTAFFSIIEPHTGIAPHRGPYKGVLRYHLALRVPTPAESCGIRIGHEVYHWQEGRSLIFDDTVTHEAWNNSDAIRVVLFVDFKRKFPAPISLINDLMIWMIKTSPFIAGIVDKVEQGK